ncbi:unnamed protein product, partial [Prunus brigantina]
RKRNKIYFWGPLGKKLTFCPYEPTTTFCVSQDLSRYLFCFLFWICLSLSLSITIHDQQGTYKN